MESGREWLRAGRSLSQQEEAERQVIYDDVMDKELEFMRNESGFEKYMKGEIPGVLINFQGQAMPVHMRGMAGEERKLLIDLYKRMWVGERVYIYIKSKYGDGPVGLGLLAQYARRVGMLNLRARDAKVRLDCTIADALEAGATHDDGYDGDATVSLSSHDDYECSLCAKPITHYYEKE